MTDTIPSLLERSGLDRADVSRHLAHGLEGADDGELFLEYRQSEALVFDNGRLKQATYDTDAGLRPARRQGRGGRLCPCLRCFGGGARARRRRGARGARAAIRGTFADAPARHQRATLWRRQSARRARPSRAKVEAAGRDRRLCARQGPARAAGDGEPRRDLAGGRDRARRRRDLPRRAAAGAASTSRSSPATATGRNPAATAIGGREGYRALHRRRHAWQRRRRRGGAPGAGQSRSRCRRRPARWTSCSAPAGRA